MNNNQPRTNYRALYGKIFAALTSQFGVHHLSDIEDAIQNSFLKSVKLWRPDNEPAKKENWLYITARNDLLNQLKRKQKMAEIVKPPETIDSTAGENDLRLETILFIAASNSITEKAKVVFLLKNIFGLSVQEIADSTLLGSEAIYKLMARAKKSLQIEHQGKQLADVITKVGKPEATLVEEVLYAIFNAGFDSFSDKHKSIINEDICLESFALAKLLHGKYSLQSTQNLLALFCFHIARMPAKVNDGKLISFFNQDRDKWSKDLINLGFHYLQRPDHPSKIYLEALIISKYMSTQAFTEDIWNDIIKLYDLLLQIAPSPIIELNYCYCLYRAGRREAAINLLAKVEQKIPGENVYLSLLKATLLSDSKPEAAQEITASIIGKMNQEIRKQYLMDNMGNFGEAREN